MVLRLDILHTRFPLDKAQVVSFVSKNIAMYLVKITPSDVGKTCYVTKAKDSSLKYIDCLPCKYNTPCEKQLVGIPSAAFFAYKLLNKKFDTQFKVKFALSIYH